MQDFKLSNHEKSEHLSFAILKCPLCDNKDCPLASFKEKRLLEKIAFLESLNQEEIMQIIKRCIAICGLKTLKTDNTIYKQN